MASLMPILGISEEDLVLNALGNKRYDFTYGHYYFLNDDGSQVYCNPRGWKYFVPTDSDIGDGLWLEPRSVIEFCKSERFTKEAYEAAWRDAQLFDVNGNIVQLKCEAEEDGE